MVRTYKRKTNRGNTPRDLMARAADQVVQKNQSLRKVATDFGVCNFHNRPSIANFEICINCI